MISRITWIVCCLALCYVPIQSQTYLGIGAGGSFSTDTPFRLFLPLGYEVKDHFSIQMEPGLIIRGNPSVIQKFAPDSDAALGIISYLHLPLLLKGRLNTPHFSLYATVGVEAAWGVKLSINYIDESMTFQNYLSFQDAGILQYDLGACGGIGIETSIRNGKIIFLDYRYYLGLIDLDPYTDISIFNQGHAFCLGLLLPLGSGQ
ncbi:MAG TPA: hypothetical protein PKA00_19670 [Saprospiraceae bacterium]|nr:hypothetical protein [Saprospiraceae bacterium]HMQ85138.1 hypothetical protein [Saprospiraceae bacterium]